MKKLFPTLFVFLLLASFTCTTLNAQEEEYYQLKTYTIKNEKQESAMDLYLKEALLPALNKTGITQVGVFKLRQNKFALANKIYVLIPFSSLSQFEGLDKHLSEDKDYQLVGSDYINASFKNPPYERFTSTILRAFTGMPKLLPSPVEGPRADRVYELRSYESPTEKTYLNKVAMFNAGGEIKLFNDLGFNAVFYAKVISGDHMPNLMYMTTHTNMEQRDAKWDAFRNSPVWKKLSAEKKYKNNMNKADILLLYPTDYSDY